MDRVDVVGLDIRVGRELPVAAHFPDTLVREVGRARTRAVTDLVVHRPPDRCEELAQRYRTGIEIDKDEIRPRIAVHCAQTEAGTIEVAEILAVGHAAQPSLKIVRPAMVVTYQA